MNELIQMVFDDYEYEKRWNCENTDFYMNLNKNIANYFLVSYIDATSESESGDSILEKLKALENNYIGEFAEKNIRKELNFSLTEWNWFILIQSEIQIVSCAEGRKYEL